ncbi:MAG: OmpA family protein [Archangium sp.]|nr:OmpA family protein [Archangium sp.]
MRLRILFVAALLATPAFAEKASVNFHLDPMVGTGLDRFKLVTGAALKIDTTLLKFLGPIAPQIEVFGGSASDRTYLDDGSVFGAGFGARVRFFNDEKGYLINPGSKHTGNLWGNLWADAHLTISSGGFGPGFDVGVGAELSLLEGLSVGPFAKFMFLRQRADVDLTPHAILLFGLSFTIGAPQTTPAEADWDNDGILGDDDKCIDEPEDKDKFEDEDGCPDKDNDKDGIEDEADVCDDQAEDKDGIADEDGCPEGDSDKDGVDDGADKCPQVKGPKENNGCPDNDKDGDGVLDRNDKCVDKPGPKENNGCPDGDTDEDGTVDRNDACKDVKGPASNKGCPWGDTDKDTVADNFDNCVNEPGPASNQGCPADKKQLVVITENKLVIKDKVFFDLNKSTIQAKSNGLLDQVAAVLNGHPEIGSIQIEGHTDNTGDAALNRTLSNDRANAVMNYLVGKGVAAARLKAVGFGPDKPADTNATPAGRDNNRRVEFNILSN